MPTLYKLIAFHSTDSQGIPVWDQPLTEGRLYFAPIRSLRDVNDRREFAHEWGSDGYVFRRYFSHIQAAYQRTFDNAAVLCLSQSLTPDIWERFCKRGGVAYGFEYDDRIANRNSITRDRVTYDDTKAHHVPSYFLSKIQEESIRQILELRSKPSDGDLLQIMEWVNTTEPRNISLRHIYEEMTFKKVTVYRVEDEFRFIHVFEQQGASPLKVRLRDSKLSFDELGLRLVAIHSDDVNRASAKGSRADIPIRTLLFDPKG
jgi:hypothetical protein